MRAESEDALYLGSPSSAQPESFDGHHDRSPGEWRPTNDSRWRNAARDTGETPALLRRWYADTPGVTT